MRSSFNYASRRFFRSCLLAAFAGAGVSGLAIAQEGEPPRAKLERGMALGTAPAGHPAHGLAPAEGAPDLCPMGDACYDLAIGYVTGRVRNPAFAESDPRGFDQVKLRGYLGEVVEFGGQRPFMAPVVELAPGDTFRLTLQNELPAWASAGDIDVMEDIMTIEFAGSWSYRSLINDPDLSTAFNDLQFGAGALELQEPQPGKIGGTLGGTGWSLALDGIATEGVPATLQWQGRGVIGGEEWVYDYLGYIVPAWPNGVNQVATIVGSIIRTEPHSGGQAPAGFTATFFAVRA